MENRQSDINEKLDLVENKFETMQDQLEQVETVAADNTTAITNIEDDASEHEQRVDSKLNHWMLETTATLNQQQEDHKNQVNSNINAKGEELLLRFNTNVMDAFNRLALLMEGNQRNQSTAEHQLPSGTMASTQELPPQIMVENTEVSSLTPGTMTTSQTPSQSERMIAETPERKKRHKEDISATPDPNDRASTASTTTITAVLETKTPSHSDKIQKTSTTPPSRALVLSPPREHQLRSPSRIERVTDSGTMNPNSLDPSVNNQMFGPIPIQQTPVGNNNINTNVNIVPPSIQITTSSLLLLSNDNSFIPRTVSRSLNAIITPATLFPSQSTSVTTEAEQPGSVSPPRLKNEKTGELGQDE